VLSVFSVVNLLYYSFFFSALLAISAVHPPFFFFSVLSVFSVVNIFCFFFDDNLEAQPGRSALDPCDAQLASARAHLLRHRVVTPGRRATSTTLKGRKPQSGRLLYRYNPG